MVQVLPAVCLDCFTESQLDALVSGGDAAAIDVATWRQHAVVRGGGGGGQHLGRGDPAIADWFWRLVGDLREEERGLLLR